MNTPIDTLTSNTLVLAAANIDTDQIIPARFLTTTASSGLGVHAFHDWRNRDDNPFADPRAAGCAILVAGDNFGCGSSREHAAWALNDLGIRAVISTRIADIFRANAVRNGILPIVIGAPLHAELLAAPFAPARVDLGAQTVTAATGGHAQFDIDPFHKHCLMHGIDEFEYLCSREDAISRFEDSADGS